MKTPFGIVTGPLLLAAIGLTAGIGCSPSSGDLLPHEKEGYVVYRAFCNQCHPFEKPSRYTAQEWPVVIGRMRVHMKEKNRKQMTDAETEALVRFLQSRGGR